MWGIAMFRFTAFIAILLCAQSATAQSTPKTPSHPVKAGDYRAKAMAFLAGNTANAQTDGSKPKVYLDLVDLNGDGIPEALARVESPEDCGTRGCTAYVLDLSRPAARSIGDFIAWSLKVLPTKTGAWQASACNAWRSAAADLRARQRPRAGSPCT